MQELTSPVGRLLKQWRGARRMSQLDLSLEAGISSRHLSFIETGRSQPSREVVLRLASAMDVPLRECNSLLGAAGYARVFRETGLDEPDMLQVRKALDHILRQQEPFPAFVLDRGWNMVLANQGATRLMAGFLAPEVLASSMANGPLNVLDLLFDPNLIRPFVADWEMVARTLLSRVQREALGDNSDKLVAGLVDRLLGYPDVPRDWQMPDLQASMLPVQAFTLRKEGLELSWFSTIATFGTPLDISVQELRIETLFPADPATEAFARS